MNKRICTCRIPTELDDRLAAVAERTHRTKSYYIRKLIEDHIQDLEDVAEMIEQIERGEPLQTLEELKRELGDDRPETGRRAVAG